MMNDFACNDGKTYRCLRFSESYEYILQPAVLVLCDNLVREWGAIIKDIHFLVKILKAFFGSLDFRSTAIKWMCHRSCPFLSRPVTINLGRKKARQSFL